MHWSFFTCHTIPSGSVGEAWARSSSEAGLTRTRTRTFSGLDSKDEVVPVREDESDGGGDRRRLGERDELPAGVCDRLVIKVMTRLGKWKGGIGRRVDQDGWLVD